MTEHTLHETAVNSNNVDDLHGKIKAILNSSLSDGAKFAALAEAVGARGAEEIAAVVKKPIRTVERHYAELRKYRQLRKTAGTQNCGTRECVIPQICVENPANLRTETTQNCVVSSHAPADITTRATNELPSEVVIENNNPPSPPTRKSKPEFGRLQALEAFHAYNETALRCGIPQASRMTPDRERKIIARLKEFGLDGWHRSLENIERSPFLKGEIGDRKWRASLDFMLQAASFAKLHDGGYSSEQKPAVRQPSAPPRIRFDEEARQRIAMEAAGVLN